MYADVTENTDRTNHSSETCPQCGAQFVTIDRRQRFCSVGCARIGSIPTGEKSPHWKGGRIIHDGYVRVRAKQHPRSSPSNPYVFEHILVIEDVLGRQLLPYERVHHKNGRRDDNRPENLELWRVKDPPGVRAADYHCFGCLCSRAQAAAAHSESPESPGAGSRISTGDIGASATGLNELLFAARPVVEHGECALVPSPIRAKDRYPTLLLTKLRTLLRGRVLLRRTRARLEGRACAPLRWIHMGICTDTPTCPHNALCLRAHPGDGANPSSSFGVDRTRASPQRQTGRQSP